VHRFVGTHRRVTVAAIAGLVGAYLTAAGAGKL
jgi:hypothetical protein